MWVAAPLLLVIMALTLHFLLKNGDSTHLPWVSSTEKFYIYLHPFENKTGERSLPEMLNYLLVESLDQFDEFKVIDRESALSIMGGGAEKVDLNILRNKFNINIQLELTGKIAKDSNNFYTIDARLTRDRQADATETGEPRLLTATGKGRDSLLDSQVDLIVRNLYQALFPEKAEQFQLKQVAQMFGKHWDTYSNFYAGLLFFKRIELPKANAYFKKASDLLISKYYLADSFYFDGSRKDALALIEEIEPVIDQLTVALQLRVKALAARLRFEPKNEIEYLVRLQEQFPFSKEVLYQLGEAYFHMAEPRKAIPYYEDAIQLDKNYSKAYNHRGYCYAYIGDHIKAIQSFQQYRVLDESANSFDSLGDGYFYSGNLLIAESMKARAVSPDENNNRIAWPYQTLADIYILNSQYQKAQNALKQYLELENGKKDTAYVLSKQAYIKYLETQYQEALTLINNALETYRSDNINDNTPEDYWLKGRILLALGKTGESKKQLQWLAQFKDNYALTADKFKSAFKYYVHLKALIAEKENKPQDARQAYHTLMQIKDKLSYWTTIYNYQYFHTQYARFLIRINDFSTALQEIETCLQFSDKDFPYIPALWVNAQILEQLNRPEEARTVYEKLAELYGESKENNRLRNLLRNKLSR